MNTEQLLWGIILALLMVIGWFVVHVRAQNAIIATQRETVAALTRQVDRLEITADLTDRFLRGLPQQRTEERT